MDSELLKARLRDKGLKATARRVSILNAISELKNHPTAEEIVRSIRNQNIKIATATVYKALDILAARRIISKVETGRNIIRYDAITETHHHLISSDSNIIKDYRNETINEVLKGYFNENKIQDFDIEEIKLQIIGRFNNLKNSHHGKKL